LADFTAPHAEPALADSVSPELDPSVFLSSSHFEAETTPEATLESSSVTAGEPESEIYPATPPVASGSMFLDSAFAGAANVASEAQSEETLQDLASRLGSLREKFLALGRKNQEEA